MKGIVIAAMRLMVENSEDRVMISYIRDGLYDRIVRLLSSYRIDISHLNKEEMEDIIIDLGRLGYEYRNLFFAIEEDKGIVEVDTNQFCNEEDIYNVIL